MRFLVMISLLLAGCGGHAPAFSPYGAIHEVVADHGNAVEFGTGFAVDHNHVWTASHVVANTTQIHVDGSWARVISFSPTDAEPALLEVNAFFVNTLPTGQPSSGPAVMESIFGIVGGTLDAPALRFAVSAQPGESGSPLVQNGVAVGVVWGFDASGNIIFQLIP